MRLLNSLRRALQMNVEMGSLEPGYRFVGPVVDYYDGPIYGFGFYFFHVYLIEPQ